MTVGSKSAAVGRVDAGSLADLRQRKEKSLPAIATIETKGFEQVVLAGMDSIWQKKYEQFTAALQTGDLLELSEGSGPAAGASAYDLYLELVEAPELGRLHGIMKRNLATALQDESQQAINAYLCSDEEEMAAMSRGDLKYTKFVRYLEKAVELLGEGHYMYKTMKAKQYYFDAVDIRVRFSSRTFSLGDSSVIWRSSCQAAAQEALKLEDKAAYIYNELYLTTVGEEKLKYLQQALELAPAWPQLYCNLGTWFIGQNQLEKADSILNIAIRLAPSFSQVYFLYGRLYYRQNKPEQAETMYKKAIEISPGHVDYKKELGEIYWIQKRYREAENLGLQVLELSPEDNNTYNMLSSMYVEYTAEYEKAIAINQQRLKMRPTDGDAFGDLLGAYGGLGQIDKIRELVEVMKHLDSTIENWEGKIALGIALFYHLGQKEEGLAVLKSAIQNAPESGWNYYITAGCYGDMGDYETFLEYIDTALSKQMTYGYTERYSNVRRAVGSPSYQSLVQKWMEQFPDWGFFQRLMGFYYDDKKDWVTALTYHKKAVELSPDNENNWFHYACSAYQSGQENTADSLFQKYLAQTQGLAGNYSRIANFYYRMRDFKKAEDFYQKTFEKDPSTAGVYYYNLSCLESLQGNHDKAFELLETALKNGYKNYPWMQQDTDLAPLREQAEIWKDLMKKYVPGQAKD